MEHRNEKKGKSWRNRLSGFFKREKKAKETEESGESGADSVKGTAKSKTKASEEPNLKEDGAEGEQPLPLPRTVYVNNLPAPPSFFLQLEHNLKMT